MMVGNPKTGRLYDVNRRELGSIVIDSLSYQQSMGGPAVLEIRARLYEAALDEMTVTEQWVNPATGEIEERTRADTARCDAIGHQFEKAAVVYRDGMAVTHCSVCDVRAVIAPDLGARLIAMHLNALAIDAMAKPPEDALLALSKAIEEVEVELDEMRASLGQARHTEAILKRRIVNEG